MAMSGKLTVTNTSFDYFKRLLLQVESRIEKILVEEDVKDADEEVLEANKEDEVLKDVAKDITEVVPEEHIKEMFQKDPSPPPNVKDFQKDPSPSNEKEEKDDEERPPKKKAVMQAKAAPNKNGASDLS